MAEITRSQAIRLQNEKSESGKLVIWSVTHNTKDFGDSYVARPIIVPALRPRDEDGYLIADTLAKLRQKLPDRLTRLPRSSQDDPVIVETWM